MSRKIYIKVKITVKIATGARWMLQRLSKGVD
jgi:hypothetical protein